ncbi:site-specific integrase [Ruegeria sediminis]|uniref:Site-specific integrase n=1 Tax=Ruegeria sediminis TaxID=2583820 RepID=A0ABY2WUN9_9RHOB|nr:site-specific integrase [Ruegeria sediminis]TMV06312.1 site-specific integrase [Ruegeria sediminis]
MALPKVTGTIQLRGRYHAKIRVPAELKDQYDGKEFYQKSLKTSDPRTAEKEVRAILAVMDAQKDKAKAEEGWKALARNLPPDQRALLDNAGGLSGLLKQFQDGKRALAFMQAGAPADAGSTDIEGGEVEYIRGDSFVVQRTGAPPTKVVTDNVTDQEELQVAVAEHRAASAAVQAQTNARGRVLRQIGQDVDLVGDVFSLRDVIEKWAPTVDPQTADAARYYVRRFNELNGEIAVTELTKAHLRDYAEAIKGLPTVLSAKLPDGRFVRDLAFNEAIAWAKKNKRDTLSDKTRDKYVAVMKRLLSFAAEQDYRQGNPWGDYKLPRVKQKHSEKQKADRRPFTPDEERRILDFVTQSNQEQYAKTTIDYWAPWIAAHHGTRLQETCQLRLCDFEIRDGVWSMQITDEGEDMRAKSGATVRWVPVHPKLMEIGLRGHIEARRKVMPAEALAFDQWERYAKRFGELQPDKRGRVSGPYGKRFATLRKNLKITGGKVAFHSFRHRLQDAADDVGMPDSHRRYLTGRANKDAVEGGYGEGAGMTYLLESLRQVDPMRD